VFQFALFYIFMLSFVVFVVSDAWCFPNISFALVSCVLLFWKVITSQKEKCGDAKGVIRIRKSKDRQLNGQRKNDKQWFTKHTH